MTHTHTCHDCKADTLEPCRINVDKRGMNRTVCTDCYEDYTPCPECGIDVHSDNACPLTDEEGGCETYGCAVCAGYRSTSYGYVKE